MKPVKTSFAQNTASFQMGRALQFSNADTIVHLSLMTNCNVHVYGVSAVITRGVVHVDNTYTIIVLHPFSPFQDLIASKT